MPAPAAAQNSQSQAAPKRQLTLFDSTSIIVGIILGASIYESTPFIASNVPGATDFTFSLGAKVIQFTIPGTVWLVGFWLLGGLLSLVGALCYAELATAYPQSGGDYVYLTRAFGRRVGFLFAWAQLWVVRPGSIGAMAYVFARYANELMPLGKGRLPLVAYAAASIFVLTAINVFGVREGKWTQNLLTLAKVLGVVAVIAAGLVWAVPAEATEAAAGSSSPDYRLALILILYAYGGWNEMAYVGAEVRNPEKNIVRALVTGTVAITLIYILINLAFVRVLGFEGFRNTNAVAATTLSLTSLGDLGGKLISLLICITALGAINGMILTGGRIYYAMGTDHRLYAWLGQWSPRWGTPARSLLIQAAVTLALVIGFGLMPSSVRKKAVQEPVAEATTDASSPASEEQPNPSGGKSAFASMVEYTTPVFWFFFLLVGETLFTLRDREPQVKRAFRVPWFPRLPIWFYLSSLFMLYSSLSYAIAYGTYEALWAVGVVVVGLIISYLDPDMKRPISQ